jgi:serine/threonine protein kinase
MVLDRRYRLGAFLGYGYEGEVYHLTEVATGIERVVKFYYPDRFTDRKRTIRLARKFHRLRHCDVVLQYYHHGQLRWRGKPVDYLVSELAQGRILHDMLDAQPRKRFTPFEALHLTHAVARGVAQIHALHEDHGDIHGENILVERRGVTFHVKLIDLFLYPFRVNDRRKLDVFDIAALLYELIGGPAGYPAAPQIVREIVCGRRRRAVYRKFPSAIALVAFMERYAWPEEE